MSKIKILSAALIVASTFAAPAFAATRTSQHKGDVYASVQNSCVRAPDVGAFASDPWRRPPCEPNTMMF